MVATASTMQPTPPEPPSTDAPAAQTALSEEPPPCSSGAVAQTAIDEEDKEAERLQFDQNRELKKLEETARGRQAFVYEGRTVYTWEQTLDEVHFYIDPPPGATKHDFDIAITPRKVRIGLRGNPPFLEEELFSIADMDCSYWMIEDGELHILLGKVHKAETWNAVFTRHGSLDLFTQQEVQKKLMLERFQEEHPGFDFSGADFSGQAPDARSFMGGVKY